MRASSLSSSSSIVAISLRPVESPSFGPLKSGSERAAFSLLEFPFDSGTPIMRTTSVVCARKCVQKNRNEILEDIESQLVRRVGELRAVPFEWGDNPKSK